MCTMSRCLQTPPLEQRPTLRPWDERNVFFCFFLLLHPPQRTPGFLVEAIVPATFVVHHAKLFFSCSITARHGETYARLDSNTLAAPRAIIPRTTSSGYTRQGAIHSLTSSSLAPLPYGRVHIWACDAVRARARARPVSSFSFSLARSLALNVRTCARVMSDVIPKIRLESTAKSPGQILLVVPTTRSSAVTLPFRLSLPTLASFLSPTRSFSLSFL